MARFNEILVGRYNRFAQKLFQQKGAASLPTLNPDLQIDMPLFNGVENRYLESWDLFSAGVQVPAVAAQFGLLKLRNPVGSNAIAVITSAVIIDTLATTQASSSVFQFSRTGTVTDENVLNAAQGWDARGRPSSTCIASHNTGAPVGLNAAITIQFGAAGANIPVQYIPPGLEVPLLPGEAVAIIGSVVNDAITGTIWWRERFLEESERA